MNRQAAGRDAVDDAMPVEQAWQPEPPEAVSLAEGVAALDEGLSPTLPLAANPAADFSALDLRDRVVIMLLFDQVVREDQVALAWRLWHQMDHDGAKEPLWRVLTLFPDLDRELVYAEAARVYGFEEARISRMKALTLIKEIEGSVRRGLWDQMVELRTMPIAELMQKHSHRKRMVFATPDPTRPEVHHLLPELDLGGFELRYARESEILNLLIEAFPRRYNHLRGLSGVTKDFLTAVYPAEEAEFAQTGPGIDDPLLVASQDAPRRSKASGLTVFEDILVDAVRQRATDLCLLPNPHGATDVYHQINGELVRQRIIEHIPAKMFLTAIKSGVIRAEGDSKTIQKRLIQRWVDDLLVRFRISAVPASEEVHSECIVVRIYA